jgi:outer membrane immunogenic protein
MERIRHLLICGDLGMHRFAVIGVGLLSIVGFACAASAADLPIKTPTAIPVAPADPSWSGCFAGVHAGGAFSYDKIRSSGDFSSAGFTAGGQFGCNYQFASAWVVGVEQRVSWLGLTSKTPGRVTPAATGLTLPTQFTVGNDFLASATARVGYGFVGGWLVYARGGVAWTREKADIVFTPPSLGFAVDPSATTTQTGWTAGTGLDWAFAPHWSTNFEYDFYDFGGNDFVLTDAANAVPVTGNLKDRIHTVTIGVNYHF